MTGSAPTPDASTLLGVDLHVLLPVVAVVLGLSLWAFGRKLLKPLLAMTGLLIGGVGGWLLGSSLVEAQILPLPMWIMAIVSGLTVACFAALGHRFLVTGVLMAVGGVVGLGLIWTLAGLSMPSLGDGPAEAETAETTPPQALPEDELDLTDWGLDLPSNFEDRWKSNLGELALEMGLPEDLDAAERVDEARGMADSGVRWIKASWAEAPQRVRTTAVAASLMGLLLGLLFATVAPETATGLVTASMGSGMFLVGGATLLVAWTADAASWLPAKPTAWFAWWAILTIIGLAIQWTRRPRKADKSG